ncbi:HlyD family efflux transporter periplasmic adaptor subunit [Sulfurimonas sp. HSL3-7]|uniref:HlyD family efflux transporter periplasmic adaptor subunit n=1 Tax=Sulfonitrofixus jiaomeiensis TaxID=3131938 RepID=UPI0031F87122
MKRMFALLLLSAAALFAKEYYSKVEPYEVLTIASNVSGQVTFADEKREGKKLDGKAYIKIDDKLDRIELENVRKKITLLRNTLKLNEAMQKNYEEILAKKETNYDNIRELKTKSLIEKDKEFYDLVTTQNQLISTEKEVDNLKVQINDLNLRAEQLQKSIDDKSLSATGKVLYQLSVKEGQVVNPGMELAKVADISRAKLTIFLNADDMKNAKSRVLYLNGEKSRYKISRVWAIADSTHLSSYKAEIIIDAPKYFSELMKVELR